MMDSVAVTFCESVISEKYLRRDLKEIVCYGRRFHQSLKRETRKVIILTTNFIQWIESRV